MSRNNEKDRRKLNLLLEDKEEGSVLSEALEKLVSPLRRLRKKRGRTGGTEGGSVRPPKRGKAGSYLQDDTKSMDRSRRLMEQEGHRRIAKVHARNHENDEKTSAAPEGELQNTILQHPLLDKQCFDGIDPNLNPEPPLNTDARREFDNAKREQEMEKQLRLGLMPKMQSAPKPSPS